MPLNIPRVTSKEDLQNINTLEEPGRRTAYELFKLTKQNQERGKKCYSDDEDFTLETTLLIYL